MIEEASGARQECFPQVLAESGTVPNRIPLNTGVLREHDIFASPTFLDPEEAFVVLLAMYPGPGPPHRLHG